MSFSRLNSSELFERSKKVTPGGVHSPVRAFRSVGGTPVFFREAKGCELISVEGRRYLDFCQSFGPLLLGHRDDEVAEVVRETVDMAWTFGACEPYSLELAEWITSRIPWVEKVRFVSSGTEAVMSALRVARAATGRTKILKFDGCYHGHVDSLLVKAGSGLADAVPGQAASDSAGVSAAVAGETLIAGLDDEEGFERIFKKHAHDLAAVIVEPLPANYGLLIQREEFLKHIEKLCRANGTLLIFDEVISGFRVGLQGMAGLLNIKPDLVTYGKVIGGGFPVGCYGGRHDLMDMVAPAGPVYQAGTLSANPVGMRAGLKTLQKAESQNLWNELDSCTRTFVDGLNSDFQSRSLGLTAARFGSIFWVHVKTDVPVIRRLSQFAPDHASRFKVLFHKALENGVYMAPSGYEVGFVGAAHSPALLAEARAQIVKSAVQALES